MNPPQVYMCSPSWPLLPPPSPFHPSGSSQCTSPKHPVLFYNNPDDCPIACFGSLAPANQAWSSAQVCGKEQYVALQRSLHLLWVGFPESSFHQSNFIYIFQKFFIIFDVLLEVFLFSTTNMDFFLFFEIILHPSPSLPQLSFQWDSWRERRWGGKVLPTTQLPVDHSVEISTFENTADCLYSAFRCGWKYCEARVSLTQRAFWCTYSKHKGNKSEEVRDGRWGKRSW